MPCYPPRVVAHNSRADDCGEQHCLPYSFSNNALPQRMIHASLQSVKSYSMHLLHPR